MYDTPQLWLQDSSYKISVEFVFAPYEAGIRYADGNSETYITSLDSMGDTIITKKYPELPTVRGKAIFTSDRQLVEVNSPNLPVEGVSVENNVWELSGERDPISFINLNEYILDFENYKTVRQDITDGTPYDVEYANYNFIDYLLLPQVQGSSSSSYVPISYTSIVLR